MAYPKEIIEKSHQLLTERRDRAVQEHARRVAQIARVAPNIIAIKNEIASTSARITAAFIDNKSSPQDLEAALAKVREFNLLKQEEMQQALVAAGFSKNAFEIHYNCLLCKDTGVYKGKLCDCAFSLQKALMYERLGSVCTNLECSFDNFSLAYYSDEIRNSPLSERAIMGKAFSECNKYASTFTLASPSLLLCGAPGLGKTHLSLAIASIAIEKGFDVLYLPFHTMLSTLEAARFGRSDEAIESFLQPINSCDLLVLDDLGSEFSTSFSLSALYDIINTRQLKSLPTIINTNLSEQELGERYGERIRSRILGGYRFIPFVGKDIRLQKKLI